MLRHLKELFYPVPTKIIYCYGEYDKEFDELPPKVELIEGFPYNLSDMVRLTIILSLETLRSPFTQTANLKKFCCNKIKIVNREMFEPYDLL